jgi:hypothetical protein
MHIVATVLYIICRQEKSPHLLIDFSDALQVNVYTIGKTFLQLSRILSLKMPVVDPCLYIHRFVTRLDLGEKMGNVSTTALRIVTRMKKDWINTGRRPDGVCSAAILIACRSYGISKSIGEIAGLFRITEATLKKRLNDFKNTPSSHLTVEQFHQHDFNFELDPPTYLHSQQLEAGRNHSHLAYNIHGDTSISNTPGSGSGSGASAVVKDDNTESDATEINKDKIDVMIDEGGRRTQVLRIGDVEIFAQLPSAIHEDDDSDSDNDMSGNRKRKALSLKGKEKDLRRRELYGQIYSNIGDVMEQQIQESSKSPSLKSTSLPNNHLQEQADMLYKEAIAVGQRKGHVGGWNNSGPKKSRGKIYVHRVPGADEMANATKSSDETKKRNFDEGEGGDDDNEVDADDNDDDDNDDRKENIEEDDEFVMSESELDSFILTSEEQLKRTALWEKMHRPFLDEQERKREARNSTASGSNKNLNGGSQHKHIPNSGMGGGGGQREGKFSFGDGTDTKDQRNWSAGGAVSSASLPDNSHSGRKSSRNINYDAMSGVEKLVENPDDNKGTVGHVDSGVVEKSSGMASGSSGPGVSVSGSQGRKIIVGATVGGSGQVSRGRGVPLTVGRSFRPNATTSNVSATPTTVSTAGVADDQGGNKKGESDMSVLVSSILTEGGDSSVAFEEDDDEDDDMLVYEEQRGTANDDYEQDDDYYD